jgi:hypothetical protein
MEYAKYQQQHNSTHMHLKISSLITASSKMSSPSQLQIFLLLTSLAFFLKHCYLSSFSVNLVVFPIVFVVVFHVDKL